MLEIRHIEFSTILLVWAEYLWPNRTSPIEPHSAIEYNTMPYIYNSEYKYNDPIFFGMYNNNELIGVNSGHQTGESFRSRGLYVFEKYRGYGYGSKILLETVNFAKDRGYIFAWSIPRQTSLNSYTSAGFIQTSDWFPTETSCKNTYVSVYF